MGRLVATPNVLSQIAQDDITSGLRRHLTGDWGELDSEDREANEQALIHGTRLLSAYHAANGTKFWIITEWDKSQTTILLPEDY